MESSYKRIGDYIQQVDVRNSDSSITELIGVSISKNFMESVANTIGTDLSKYKVISKGQFACSLMQVSRDGGIAISLYKEDTSAIMSPAYFIFEVSSKELLAEYLELVVYNPTFDREAVFNAIGGVRGTLSWDEFCDMKINIPPLEEQQKIVRQYKTITDRIGVLEKINEELTELCKAQLREYKPIVENAKSTSFVPIRELVESNIANYSSKDKLEEIIYLDTGSITDNYVSETQVIYPKKESVPSRCKRKVKNRDIIFSTVRPGNRHFGILYNPEANYIVSTGFSVLSASQDRISPEFIYMWLTSDEILSDLNEIAELSVTTYPSISNDDLVDVVIEIPDDYDFTKMNEVLHSSMLTIDENSKELRKLQKVKDIYLGMKL